MATKRRNGSNTIIRATKKICRIVGVYGTKGLHDATNDAFVAAVLALVAACQAFEALDDFPFFIDDSAPYGPEDLVP